MRKENFVRHPVAERITSQKELEQHESEKMKENVRRKIQEN